MRPSGRLYPKNSGNPALSNTRAPNSTKCPCTAASSFHTGFPLPIIHRARLPSGSMHPPTSSCHLLDEDSDSLSLNRKSHANMSSAAPRLTHASNFELGRGCKT